MADYGAKFADKKIRKVDRQLQAIYRQAEKELKEKLADFVRRSKAQNELKQKQLKAGIITEEEYQDWLKGQVFQKKRWESKIKSAQQIMHDHNVEAAKIVHENKLDVYNENYLYQQYEMEMITGMSFDIYSEQAVSKLIKDREKLLPEWKIDEKKDYKWNYRKVNNAIAQGIIQGESVEKIMNRLATDLSSANEAKMRMFARTAITGAQNAGHQQQMEDAEKNLGIKQEKEWIATLDMRTRDAHRHLDGERVPYNKSFMSDLGLIRFPGDPQAAIGNIANCRCDMLTIYPEYQTKQDNWRENETIDGMSYQEWKENGKKKGLLKFTEKNIIINGAKDEITPEAEKITTDTINAIFDKYAFLRKYMREITYEDIDGIAASSIDGKILKLDKKAFSTVEAMQNVIDSAVKEGHSVNTNNPAFIIAHDLGHCIESYIIAKKLRLTNSVINELQESAIRNERKKMGIDYFNHMGFKNETTDQIYAIIKKELGSRALDSPSEMAAQSFAQVLYGTKQAPHAKKLVEYLISLAR